MRKLIMFVCGVIVILAMVLAGCGADVKTTTTTTTTAPKTTTTTTTATSSTATTSKPPTSTTTTTGTAPAATVTQTVQVERNINALSPRGIALPVQTKPLAARLDTLKGKTIYVAQGEADPVIMPAVYDWCKAKYPDTNWVNYQPTSGFGPTTPTSETLTGSDTLKKADAVIRGIGW